MYRKLTIKSSVIPVILSLALSACGGGGGGGTNAGNPNSNIPIQPSLPTTIEERRLAELTDMDELLRNNHPDLFFSLSETDWQNQIQDIRGQVADISDLGFMFEVTKMVATLGDQHTYVIMPQNRLRQFPLEVWWDGDRAIVTKASNDYQNYLGHELRSIDGTPMLEIRESVMQYLAFENEYWKVGISPNYLKYADVMAYEGLIASADSASVQFVSPQNETLQVEVDTTLGETDLIAIETTQAQVPAYFSNIEANYSVQLVEDDIFIQYTSAFDMPAYSLIALLDDMRFIMDNNEVDNVIVDVRFNLGGLIDHFVPVIQFLASSEFNNAEDLFVITGRRTFSSGVGATYSFNEMTNATFVGMPTGGKPNGFSFVAGVGLPVSGSNLFYSLQYLQLTEGDPDAFVPDHLTPFTQNDFTTGKDPALEYIRANW